MVVPSPGGGYPAVSELRWSSSEVFFQRFCPFGTSHAALLWPSSCTVVMEFTYDIWYLMNRNQQSYWKLSPTVQKKWCIIFSQLYLHDAKPTEVLRAQIDFIMDVLTTSHYEDLIKSPGHNHRTNNCFFSIKWYKKKYQMKIQQNAHIIRSRKPAWMLSVVGGYETDGLVIASFPSAIQVLL